MIDLIGLNREELAALVAGLDSRLPRESAHGLALRPAGRRPGRHDRSAAVVAGDPKGAKVRVRPLVEVKTARGFRRHVKFLFALADGAQVESVFIPEGPRRTVCLSRPRSAAGWVAPFAPPARSGLLRNLTAGEIVGQVIRIGQLRECGSPTSWPWARANRWPTTRRPWPPFNSWAWSTVWASPRGILPSPPAGCRPGSPGWPGKAGSGS